MCQHSQAASLMNYADNIFGQYIRRPKCNTVQVGRRFIFVLGETMFFQIADCRPQVVMLHVLESLIDVYCCLPFFFKKFIERFEFVGHLSPSIVSEVSEKFTQLNILLIEVVCQQVQRLAILLSCYLNTSYKFNSKSCRLYLRFRQTLDGIVICQRQNVYGMFM